MLIKNNNIMNQLFDDELLIQHDARRLSYKADWKKQENDFFSKSKFEEEHQEISDEQYGDLLQMSQEYKISNF